MGKTIFCGYRHVKYTNKEGRDVEGYSLYFTEERKGVEGMASFDAWVSVDTFLNHFSCVTPGSLVELTYNRFGNLSGVSISY